jgi:hypothetical protein
LRTITFLCVEGIRALAGIAILACLLLAFPMPASPVANLSTAVIMF